MKTFKFLQTGVPLVICLCSTLFADVYTVPSTEYDDTFLRSGSPNTNNDGGLVLVGTVNSSDVLRAVYTYDLSHIGAGATVSDVTFTLTQDSGDVNSVSEIITVDLYELDQAFDNGQATWNSYSTGNTWATPGGDFTTKLASASGNPRNTVSPELVFSSAGLTSAVEAAAGGNLYLLVKLETEANDRRIFRLIDDSNPGRPSLEITYTAIPEPSTLMLLFLSGASGLLLLRKRSS